MVTDDQERSRSYKDSYKDSEKKKLESNVYTSMTHSARASKIIHRSLNTEQMSDYHRIKMSEPGASAKDNASVQKDYKKDLALSEIQKPMTAVDGKNEPMEENKDEDQFALNSQGNLMDKPPPIDWSRRQTMQPGGARPGATHDMMVIG